MNIKYLLTLFFLSIICSSELLANDYIAKVVMLKGKATVLPPLSKRAILIKPGQKLKRDSSIVTYDKSFLRVKMNDGATLSLGPNSKFVIVDGTQDNADIISLLNGMIRVDVDKSKLNQKNIDNKSKFILRTRSAAMGVRGTEFMAIYNPQNKITSLLTYEGNVHLAKFKGQAHSANEEHFEAVEVDEVDDRLEDADAVEVKHGQYASVVQGLPRATLPIKVSPVQLTLLYKNKNFDERQETSSADGLRDFERRETMLPQADQAPPQEGYYDKVSGEYAARSGGFLDLKTGIYIPPEPTSNFSEKYALYEGKALGNIDEETGQYIPPKGLKLTSLDGFVPVSKKENVDVNKIEELNQTLKSDILHAPDDSGLGTKYPTLMDLQSFKKHSIIFSLLGHSQEIEVSGNSTGIADTIKSDDGTSGFELEWRLANRGSWQPFLALRQRSFGYDDASFVFDRGESDTTRIGAGFRYKFFERLNLLSEIQMDQQHVLESNLDGTGSHKLQVINIPKIMFGPEVKIIHGQRFHLLASLGLGGSLSRTVKGLTVDSGFLTSFKLNGFYRMGKTYWLRGTLWNEKSSTSVSSVNYNTDLDIDNGGLQLAIGATI